MFRTVVISLLSLLGIFGGQPAQFSVEQTGPPASVDQGTLEKLAAATGSLTMEIDPGVVDGKRRSSKVRSALRFEIDDTSFFTVLVFNNELRGPLPGSMKLVPRDTVQLSSKLAASQRRLVLERTAWNQDSELIVRDGETGFVFFLVDGHQFDYEPRQRLLTIGGGLLRLSPEFAAELGRPADAGSAVGQIAATLTMRALEVSQLVNGEIVSAVMPASTADGGGVPGPDVIVGDVSDLSQFGSTATQVGLAVGTDSCNAGNVPLNWFQLPSNDHPVIPQNLYRMSGGPDGHDRFEQIGQSSVKHAFTALAEDLCGFGCQGSFSGTLLGPGCSDPYSASLNAGPSLGSRAWINPFTGFYPRGDSATSPNSHAGHAHNGVSHRILTQKDDLNTTLNPGATYYAEAQYITPHEYAWCQANPGQCNMYNNVSYRQFRVTGTTNFAFTALGSTIRTLPAVAAWPNSTRVEFQPAPGTDGVAAIAYKVTNPSPGVWHYEYAVYNQNLDRAIQSLSVPVGTGAVLTNVGFRAPVQHPGWPADGTVGSTGYSAAPWMPMQTASAITWNTETFAQNPNANAIRWGTMYNFRFDANTPPQTSSATIGFFKTGDPITVQIQGPGGAGSTPTPTPTPTPVTVPTPPGIEADLAPRPSGNGSMTASDSAQFKRFIAGLDTFSTETNEFQRADVAPKDTRGDGRLTAADQQQLDNYIAGLDPLTTGGGPTGPVQGRPADDRSASSENVPLRTYRILPAAAGPGSAVVVAVELNGNGVETAMSFTILFDREILEFRGIGGTDNDIDVMPGKGSPGELMRTVNATSAHKGRLGLLLQSRTAFEAGRREILYLRFHVREDARPGNTSLAFGDGTLVRSTTNAAGAQLGAGWHNGTVKIGERRTAENGWISTLGGGDVRGPVWPARSLNSPF